MSQVLFALWNTTHLCPVGGCEKQVLISAVSSFPGSVPSLAAGLLFGGLAGFGAYQVSNDPNNIWVSLGWYLVLCVWVNGIKSV